MVLYILPCWSDIVPYVLLELCTFVEPQVWAVMPVWVAEFTLRAKEQVCPPTPMVKLAVPLDAGVPVIVYVKLPAPLSKVPAAKLAVKPVTPVDVMVCAEYVPPFPPVYVTLLLTLAAATPCVSVPVLVAVEQLSAVMIPAGGFTVLVKVQVCPPMFRAKLAVPFEAGVPVMVKVKLPAPVAKAPAAHVAVRPVTPVDVKV